MTSSSNIKTPKSNTPSCCSAATTLPMLPHTSQPPSPALHSCKSDQAVSPALTHNPTDNAAAATISAPSLQVSPCPWFSFHGSNRVQFNPCLSVFFPSKRALRSKPQITTQAINTKYSETCKQIKNIQKRCKPGSLETFSGNNFLAERPAERALRSDNWCPLQSLIRDVYLQSVFYIHF